MTGETVQIALRVIGVLEDHVGERCDGAAEGGDGCPYRFRAQPQHGPMTGRPVFVEGDREAHRRQLSARISSTNA